MADDLESRIAFEAILARHMENYPEARIDDLYKLVFQTAMGSEHALAGADQALRILQVEAEGLEPSGQTPLMESISPDHRLVRLHIRPYLAAGGDLGALARAFVQTARTFTPSTRRLAQYWIWATRMARNGDLPFGFAGLHSYGERRRTQGYPAVHHSSHFRNCYRPAYRVVLKELIEGRPE